MDDEYWALMNSTYSPIIEKTGNIMGQLYD